MRFVRVLLLAATLVGLTACSINHPSAVALVDGVVSIELKPCSEEARVGLVRLYVIPDDDNVVGDENDRLVWEARLVSGRGTRSFPLVGAIHGYRIKNQLRPDGLRRDLTYGVEAATADDVDLGALGFQLSELREGTAFWESGGKKHHDPISRWRARSPEDFPDSC